MRNKKILAIWAVIVILTLSCGLTSGISGLVGGNKTTTVNDLWSDVPRMDGMTKVDMELPLPAKLAIQGFIKSSSKGEGSLDFIAFTTPQSVADVTNFYSTTKMEEAGWTLPDQPGCSGEQSAAAGGAVCFYGKQNPDNTGSFLVIFAGEDSKSNQTQVFFMRVDAKDLPTQSP
jgi:hypothetical protein